MNATANEGTDQKSYIFDRIVISASQEDQKIGEVDGSVTVIESSDIQRNLSDSVKDLFKYVPSVTTGGGRQADSLINIRGIDGNRVLISVDGVKQAKNLSWGSTNSSRNTIDVNTLKRVEVVPGPGSSLYGSDAMGGSVYFVTKDPSDVLTESGDGFAGSSRTYYDSSNKSISESISLAGRNGDVEGLLIYTYRDRKETETYGGNGGTGPTREQANPSDGEDNNLLVKINIDINETQQLKLTGEYVNIEDDITELSSNYDDAFYNDHKTRKRLSAEYAIEKQTTLFDEATVKLDWQETNTDQTQGYYYIFFGGDYLFEGEYDETVKNLDFRFKKKIHSDNTSHAIQYGFDFEKTLFEQHRTSSLSGSNRSMPRSEAESIAAYVQDTITFTNSGWTLTPGLRFDSHEVAPEPDAAYLASNPSDLTPEKNKEDRVSLKLGATYKINEELSVFAQYAEGFKAPDMDQLYANYGRMGAYNFISNANLKPETSDSIEVGFRIDKPALSLEALAFYNDYENFIDEVTLSFDPSYPYGVFQQQNLSDVQIKGVELKGEVHFSELSDSLTGLSGRGAIAYADGEYNDSGVTRPLDSVSPLTAVIGLAYDAPTGNWGSEFTLTAAQGKKAKDVEDSSAFLPAGYGIVDLTAYLNINKDLRLDAGIFNLTDREYWDWETARRYTSTHTGLVRFSEPGRHFRVGLDWKF